MTIYLSLYHILLDLLDAIIAINFETALLQFVAFNSAIHVQGPDKLAETSFRLESSLGRDENEQCIISRPSTLRGMFSYQISVI